MRKRLLILYLSAFSFCTSYGQIRITPDSVLEKEIVKSSFIHSPLPINYNNSLENNGWNKKINYSTPITEFTSLKECSIIGIGGISIQNDKTDKNTKSVKLAFPNSTGKRAVGSPSDPDYATYGESGITYHLNGMNLEKYNRIVFSIYPDCDGTRIVNANLSFVNAENTPKRGYNKPSGTHLINLTNKKWNKCSLDFDEYQRDKVMNISFTTSLKGKDRTMGDSSRYYIKDVIFENIDKPEKVSGWTPDDNKIIYSHTGYITNSRKIAIVNGHNADTRFEIVDASLKKIVFSSTIKKEKTTIGEFGIIDFSNIKTIGNYYIRVGKIQTPSFQISDIIWQNSQWRVLNFIFSQRCGYPVPAIHSTCHEDLMSGHNGKRISYSGGWHDAGDLSQQTLQTGDVAYSLLEASQKIKRTNSALASRLREEAEWGLEFVLKNRFGDGYRASSMGLLIWQDGVFNSFDDIKSVRVQNNSFDNFLYSAYEAYASMTLENDPMLNEYLRRIAEEDFSFAMEKFKKDGFDKFIQPYEHTYNTSKSQYMATISWAASQLYKLTMKKEYAQIASEYINYTLDCQQKKPLNDKDKTCGFFYRDMQKRSIVHYIHQSREQVYMQAITLLCQTQPENPNYSKWVEAVKLYGEYIKGLMKYTYPYGMIPSGVYNSEEYKDSANFYALHLFPPTNAKELYTEQINNGVKIDKNHYIKRFPVWFNIFNGNTAIHLSTGKAAAICGNFLHDKELLEIGMEQLYWTVGKNPFGQSLIYGEGHDYPQMNSFSSGEITGEMPVGIRSLGNDDIPYWPQTNNACYKEVWVTSAGKWLSLISEY